MKLIILATFFVCAFGAPNKKILPQNRIVGGTETVPGELPFQVTFRRCPTVDDCVLLGSGTILDASTILTSADIVNNKDVGILVVTAGEYSLSQVSRTEQASNVASYVVHENYRPNILYNDIALVYLERPLVFNDYVAPIRLPLAGVAPPTGYMGTVSGWGTPSIGGNLSDVPLKIDVPVVSDESCEKIYGNIRLDGNSMICAGFTEGGAGGCLGDSGAPYFIGSGQNATQHGIVAWGNGCAEPGYPGVYTQVSSFIQWIADNRP